MVLGFVALPWFLVTAVTRGFTVHKPIAGNKNMQNAAKQHVTALQEMTEMVKKMFLRRSDTLELMKNILLKAAQLIKTVNVDIGIYSKMDKAASVKQ